jgi:hypothetical protein
LANEGLLQQNLQHVCDRCRQGGIKGNVIHFVHYHLLQ